MYTTLAQFRINSQPHIIIIYTAISLISSSILAQGAQSGDLDAALECAEERLAVLRGIHDLSMEAGRGTGAGQMVEFLALSHAEIQIHDSYRGFIYGFL